MELAGLSGLSLGELRSVPVERFVLTQQQWSDGLVTGDERGVGLSGLNALGPVVDGKRLPTPPRTAIAQGAAADVGLFVGCTSEELRFGFGADLAARGLMRSDGSEFSSLPVGPSVLSDLGAHEEHVRTIYGKSLEPVLGRPPRDADIWVAAADDRGFIGPAVAMAEAQSQHHAGTYLYRFGWRSPVLDGQLGAAHAIDNAFWFDTLADPAPFGAFMPPTPPQELADQMHRSLIAFASRGNPAHPGLPEWPAYDSQRRATMVFGRHRWSSKTPTPNAGDSGRPSSPVAELPTPALRSRAASQPTR